MLGFAVWFLVLFVLVGSTRGWLRGAVIALYLLGTLLCVG